MRLQEFPGALYSAEIMGDERKEGGGANDTGNEGPLQIHVHRVGDAIQPSHPLSSTSPPALNLSQHQGLFK